MCSHAKKNLVLTFVENFYIYVLAGFVPFVIYALVFLEMVHKGICIKCHMIFLRMYVNKNTASILFQPLSRRSMGIKFEFVLLCVCCEHV